MECVLHVGMHKTGTSSIQRALDGYDDGDAFYANLNSINHSIPVQALFHQNNLRAHWVNEGFTDEQIANHIAKLDQMFTAAVGRQKRKKVIFSGENISILDAGSLTRLKKKVEEHCDTVRVVLFARNPYDEAASSFQEVVKHGWANIPEVLNFNGSFESRYKTLVRVFGEDRVTVRFYEDKKDFDDDIVKYFFDLEGLKLKQKILSKPRENTSISRQALKLIFRLNSSNGVTTQGPILRAARWKMIFALDTIITNGARIDKSVFVDRVDQSNVAFLKNKFGREYSFGETNPMNLDEWMTQIDQAALDDISRFLKSKGFYGKFNDPTVIINQLYYYFFVEVYNKENRKSAGKPAALGAESVKLLEIEEKVKSGQKIEIDDAKWLMSLAQNARPSSSLKDRISHTGRLLWYSVFPDRKGPGSKG